jgi:hypothetical protein
MSTKETDWLMPLMVLIVAVSVGVGWALKDTTSEPERKFVELKKELTKKQVRSKRGKRRCKANCKGVNGKHTAHGPIKCICRDKDGCIIVFTSARNRYGSVIPYEYDQPTTVGKCARRSQ